MRKGKMYTRLSLDYLKRSRGIVLPSFICGMTCIALFTIVMLLSQNSALGNLPAANTLFRELKLAAVILGLLCFIIIAYINSFTFKQRTAELGVYVTLGFSKKDLRRLVFKDSLLSALICCGGGIILGLSFSRLMFLVMLKLAKNTNSIVFEVPLRAVLASILFAAACYAAVGLINVVKASRFNPLQLISQKEKGEKEPRYSKIIAGLGLICLGAGYIISLTEQTPTKSIISVFIAVVLVCIATYCLFISGSIAFLKHRKKNESYYTNKESFINTSNMMFRMKRNAAGLASICLLSCMAIITLAVTASLYGGLEHSLRRDYPYDFTLKYAKYGFDKQAYAEKLNIILAETEKTAEETGLIIDEMYVYPYTELEVFQTGTGSFQDLPDRFYEYDNMSDAPELQNNYVVMRFMLLEDYNRIEGKDVKLGNNEALVFSENKKFKGNKIMYNGINLDVKEADSFRHVKNGTKAQTTTITVFLASKEEFERISGYPNYLIYAIDFNVSGEEAQIKNFVNEYKNFVNSEEGNGIRYGSYYIRREDNYFRNGGYLFLGVFFSAVFLLVASIVIFYKQISEGAEDRENFAIMQKLGMSKRELRIIINKQVRSFFFLPLGAACAHVLFAFPAFSRALVSFGVYNTGMLFGFTLLAMALYALVYYLVYRRTANSFLVISS